MPAEKNGNTINQEERTPEFVITLPSRSLSMAMRSHETYECHVVRGQVRRGILATAHADGPHSHALHQGGPEAGATAAADVLAL